MSKCEIRNENAKFGVGTIMRSDHIAHKAQIELVNRIIGTRPALIERPWKKAPNLA